MRSHTTIFLLSLIAGACGPHRGVTSEMFLEPTHAASLFRGDLADLFAAYEAFTDPGDPGPRTDGAVHWLREKPQDLADFEALAREVAGRSDRHDAAGAWLLMGNAWLYLAERGRRIPPPAYTDVQAAQVWDEVVSRSIDPRFADLEEAAMARLRRCIEIGGPRDRYAVLAADTLARIEARRRMTPLPGAATRNLPLLVDAADP